MTNLIYRGVKHDVQFAITPRKAQKLIYRGVAHDGLSTAAKPAHHCQAEMCYRGVRYSRGANGIVIGSAQKFPTGPFAEIAV